MTRWPSKEMTQLKFRNKTNSDLGFLLCQAKRFIFVRPSINIGKLVFVMHKFISQITNPKDCVYVSLGYLFSMHQCQEPSILSAQVDISDHLTSLAFIQRVKISD